MTFLLHRVMPETKYRLTERQIALADRIFALETWELIDRTIRDAMLDRLKENLDRLDYEITSWEALRTQ